jgi:hypothetical protein
MKSYCVQTHRGFHFLTTMGMDRKEFLRRLDAFANLVAKHTLMNIDPSKFISCQEVMEAARMAEREACAKVIESHGETLANGAMLVEAIRARGEA